MRASAAIALLAVLVCPSMGLGQDKGNQNADRKPAREVQGGQSGKEKPTSQQTDAIVIQAVPKITSAAQHADAKAAESDSTEKKSGIVYNVHMSDCENRWVALYHEPTDPDYMYGFVYIDPQGGFTWHHVGRFSIDSEGNYHPAPDPIDPEKMSLKLRLDQNGVAALLPQRALTQLQLPEKPDWLKFYEDKSDPVIHKLNWGFHYNAIGDSQRAIAYLEPAYSEKPDNPRIVFELAYAYNALGRPKDALRVAKAEFDKNPKNELLCREIGFAYMTLESYKEATNQFLACIALCDDSEAGMEEKSEEAMNLRATYGKMGDKQNFDLWEKKARDWAPKGSIAYKFFHPDEQ